MTTQSMYYVGGTVPVDQPSYIARPADAELLALCHERAFAYILTARQLGKSSLVMRTAERLEDQGIRTVYLDLTYLGTEVHVEQWYRGLLIEIAKDLFLHTDIQSWWEYNHNLTIAQRLTLFFQEVLLAEVAAPVVIFVDEIDTTLSLDFTDDFFTVIRLLYNERATQPDLRRLSFVLIGVAEPGDLISNPKRTPFNIGQRVDLEDFTLDEAQPLADGLGLPRSQAIRVLNWALDWTEGHPFLTQYLCREIARRQDDISDTNPGRTRDSGQTRISNDNALAPSSWSEASVEQVVRATFFGEQSDKVSNLQFVRNMLTRHSPDMMNVLRIYREIRRGRPVADDEQSRPKSHLKLSGVVRREQGLLRVRNHIYAEVFDQRWIREHWPLNWWQAMPTGIKIATFSITLLALVLIGVTAVLFNVQNISSERLTTAQTAQANAIGAQQTAEALRLETEQRLRQARAAQAFAIRDQQPNQAILLTIASAPSGATADSPIFSRAVYSVFDTAMARRILIGDKGNIRAIAWSPDGRQILTGSLDGTARVRDAITGEQLLFMSHGNGVVSVAWSPDGRSLLIGCLDGVARIYHATTGKIIRSFSHDGAVESVAWSPDGQQILASSNKERSNDNESPHYSVQTWDATSGAPLLKIDGFTHHVWTAAWSPDGRRILTGSADTTARIWDAKTGQQLMILKGHTEGLLKVAWSPDGQRVLTSADDRIARIWDATTGALLFSLEGHQGPIWSIAWSPNGRRVVTGSNDRTARIWDATTGASVRVLEGHTDAVLAVAWSPDGHWILTGTGFFDRAIRVWDAADEPMVLTDTISVAWSPDSQKIVTGGSKGDVHIWNVATGTRELELVGHAGPIWDVAWSRDGKQVLTGSRDRTARIWNAVTGKLEATLTHDGSVMAVAWSPDGKFVLSGTGDIDTDKSPWPMPSQESRNGSVQIWDATTGSLLRRLQWPQLHVWDVAWSPDGRLVLASGGGIYGQEDDTIRIWNAMTGAEQQRLQEHRWAVTAAAWSPDGSSLLTGTWDNAVHIWDVKTGKLVQTLADHENLVWSVAWRPDGTQILTGSWDGIARIWDAKTGTLLRTLKGSLKEVTRVAWSPDGRFIAASSLDGTVRIWVADPRLMIAVLTRRACDIYHKNDAAIRNEVPNWAWRGCDTELNDVAKDLEAYDRLGAKARR